MKQGKINGLQAFMILMLSAGLMNHVILIPVILDAAGRDAWISVIFTTVLLMIWSLLLWFIMKQAGQMKLLDWLKERTNTFIAWLMMIPIGLYLFSIGGNTIIHTASWTITNYLPSTPMFVLSLTLILVASYTARSGLNGIAICSGILLPIVILLGYFVAISNTPYKEFGLLFPVLEHGPAPVLKGMIYAGGGFVELLLLLFFQHQIKSKVRLWQLLVFVAIIGYITLGPLTAGIMEFGPMEAAKQVESPYEQWRLVKIGHYIEHVDFLSVYQWLSGAFIRITLSMYLLAELFTFKTVRARNNFIRAIAVCYLIISLIPVSYQQFYTYQNYYYFPITLIGVIVLTMIWGGIALYAKPSKGGTT